MPTQAPKLLPGLRLTPGWTTHMCCLKSCLDYLGLPVSRGWLYGGTGHAFVLNVHEGLCPSGPTAWNTAMLFQLAPNLGYRHKGIAIWRGQAGDAFRGKQREAFDLVRDATDRNLPCYGWQLQVPEYYLITGYDDVGYYYAGPGAEEGGGPLPWDRLATWDVDLLEVYQVEPVPPAPAAKAVKAALEAALKHAWQPAEGVRSMYHVGPAGFEVWAQALEEGRASRNGCAFNAAVWHECRQMAVDFLAEAAARLPAASAALTEAGRHYAAVRDRLAELSQLMPEQAGLAFEETVNTREGAALMRAAVQPEREGLECLERIAAAL